MSKYYHFETADIICDYYNKYVNSLNREKQEMKEKYPWLYEDDERKYMTHMEVLDKYVDLDNSYLTDIERKEVRDMLYRYKDIFSLRDEIGTCPNIEVEIDDTDRTPFFIRPYHAKEEDKTILDKEMKRFGYFKRGILAYSSPVMLISRKMTKTREP